MYSSNFGLLNHNAVVAGYYPVKLQGLNCSVLTPCAPAIIDFNQCLRAKIETWDIKVTDIWRSLQIHSLSLLMTLSIQFTIQNHAFRLKLRSVLYFLQRSKIQSNLEGLYMHPQVTSSPNLEQSTAVFPQTIALSLKIICRPCIGPFSLELLSVEEIVPMKTVHSATSMIGTLVLERRVAIGFSRLWAA